MVVKQSGLSINSDEKVITTEKFFDILVGSLYASDFCGQTTVGDLQLMSAVYLDMKSLGFDMVSLYGERGLVTRLLADYLKANPRKHSSRLISVEFIFEDNTQSRTKKLKAKAIKLVTLNKENGDVEKVGSSEALEVRAARESEQDREAHDGTRKSSQDRQDGGAPKRRWCSNSRHWPGRGEKGRLCRKLSF